MHIYELLLFRYISTHLIWRHSTGACVSDLGNVAREWLRPKAPTLAKGHKISLLFGAGWGWGGGIAFYAFIGFPSMRPKMSLFVSWNSWFPLEFLSRSYLFFPFCFFFFFFAPKETAVKCYSATDFLSLDWKIKQILNYDSEFRKEGSKGSEEHVWDNMMLLRVLQSHRGNHQSVLRNCLLG